MKNSNKIIHITDSIPFHNGGVSDYAYLISKGLKENYKIETFFVTCNSFKDFDTSIFKDITNINKNKNLYETVKNIMKKSFDKNEKINILLEYVPHAYQKRGCPFWLLNELKKIKKNIPNVNLITMFHELYATSSNPKTSTFWLQGVQKFITKSIHILSDSTFTNTLKYKSELKNWKDKEIQTMSVFSNIGKSDELIPFERRNNYAIVFGSIGKRQKVYDEKEALTKWCKNLNIEKIIDIGSGKPNIEEIPLKIELKGRMESNDIISLIQNIKYGFVNNLKGGSLEKSGIYASYIANNLCSIVLECYENQSIYKENEDYLKNSYDDNHHIETIILNAKSKYDKNASLELHINNFFYTISGER